MDKSAPSWEVQQRDEGLTLAGAAARAREIQRAEVDEKPATASVEGRESREQGDKGQLVKAKAWGRDSENFQNGRIDEFHKPEYTISHESDSLRSALEGTQLFTNLGSEYEGGHALNSVPRTGNFAARDSPRPSNRSDSGVRDDRTFSASSGRPWRAALLYHGAKRVFCRFSKMLGLLSYMGSAVIIFTVHASLPKGHYDRRGSRLEKPSERTCSDFFLNADNHAAALLLPLRFETVSLLAFCV